MLAAAEGRTVGKDELLARAWPGIIVEEGNLTVQVAALRKAMGPMPDGRDWIVTVPRAGYRLVAPDRAPAAADATRRRSPSCRSRSSAVPRARATSPTG